MKNKNLILFTHGFPYGKGEQFLETEINILSLSFDYILIYPISLEGEKRDIPKNVEVKYFERGSKFSIKWLIIRKWKVIFKVFILEFFHTTRKRFYKKKKFYYLDSLFGKINDAEKLEKELNSRIRSLQNQQLNQYSNIYFNKIKKDIVINEK